MITTQLQPLPHGITLSVRSAGAPGRPVLLFLHGFPEGAFVWDALLAHFSQPLHGGFRCVAPNLRGFEQSSAPPEPAAYRAKHLVQDIAALIAIESPGQPLAALVAHDWGGAVAWNLANQQPGLMQRLCILNSPHPGTFLRDMQHDARQQAASAYMNFLIRPDAEEKLAEQDYRRLWVFLNQLGQTEGAPWLTKAVKAQYRAVWADPPGTALGTGLRGGCNYYRASPLRPPRADDPAAQAISLPREMLTVQVPTQVIWGLQDHALLPGLLDGLTDYIPQLSVHRVPDASHWIVHEQPEQVIALLADFLAP
ncbi:MAG: alpha/beta fold hydrolase [Burkholderiales bacterium]